jgi:hypothetical protein
MMTGNNLYSLAICVKTLFLKKMRFHLARPLEAQQKVKSGERAAA